MLTALLSELDSGRTNECEDSDSEDDVNFDEENIIKYYFKRGFGYNEIVNLLEKRHNHQTSYSTLLRRMKTYGLSRRGFSSREDFDAITEKVRRRVGEIINGPGSCEGYRSVWHTLEMEGLRVPRMIVQDILKELDPEGTESRKAFEEKGTS